MCAYGTDDNLDCFVDEATSWRDAIAFSVSWNTNSKIASFVLDLTAILQWNGKKTWTMMILLFAIGYADQIGVAE
jgi:hypothetical protein